MTFIGSFKLRFIFLKIYFGLDLKMTYAFWFIGYYSELMSHKYESYLFIELYRRHYVLKMNTLAHFDSKMAKQGEYHPSQNLSTIKKSNWFFFLLKNFQQLQSRILQASILKATV